MDLIRRAFNDDLKIELNGPGGVGLYLFGDNQYVLYNMSDEPASIKLRSIQKISKGLWKELVRGENLPVTLDSTYVRFGAPVITEVPITIKPFEIVVIQAP